MNQSIRILLALLLALTIGQTTLQAQRYTTTNNKAIKAFEKGQEALYQSHPNDAIRSFQQALQYDPNFIEANIILAEWYLDANQPQLAKQHYYAAVQTNPTYFTLAWLQLGQLELADNNYTKAQEAYTQFLNHDKKNPDRHPTAQLGLLNAQFRPQAIANPVPFQPQNLGPNINTPHDEYLPALTADGKTLIFTRRMPRKPTSTCSTPEEEDFYQSTLIDGTWSKATRMAEPVNSNDNEGAQCISQDGRIMIFTACERRDGAGRCDLYQCLWHGNQWSKPRNMGPAINTPSWESQPSLSLDGHTLYFVSDRKGGYGGTDIWKSTLRDGQWTTPVNLGPTINTPGNESCPFIHYDNLTLYFTSDGHVGMGGTDIYLTRLQDDNTWSTPQNLGYPINTQADESNLIVAPDGQTAIFSSDKINGYGRQDLFTFQLPEPTRPQPIEYHEEIAEANQLQVGESITLDNVFFQTGRYTLLESSLVELDKVVELLQSHPTMKIQLGGHTDNTGNPIDNQRLSEQRAKACHDYLIQRGINPTRLSYKGYGETNPIATNDTEQGRAQNRRTVFTITEK